MKTLKIISISALLVSLPVSSVAAAEPAAKEKAVETVSVVKAEDVPKVLEKDPKIVIVDLRTPEEFAEGHIAKAVNINFLAEDFAEKLAKLDRDKTYLMHCRSGGRSSASLETWKKLGFKKVIHLDSGILGYQKAGLKVVKEEKAEKAEKE